MDSHSYDYAKAIELDPQNALALREMGSYLLAKGDFDLARAFYVRALTADQIVVTVREMGCEASQNESAG